MFFYEFMSMFIDFSMFMDATKISSLIGTCHDSFEITWVYHHTIPSRDMTMPVYIDVFI